MQWKGRIALLRAGRRVTVKITETQVKKDKIVNREY
jgi:hypothetical protein